MSGNMRAYSSGWDQKPTKRKDVRQPKVRKGRENPSSKAAKKGGA